MITSLNLTGVIFARVNHGDRLWTGFSARTQGVQEEACPRFRACYFEILMDPLAQPAPGGVGGEFTGLKVGLKTSLNSPKLAPPTC